MSRVRSIRCVSLHGSSVFCTTWCSRVGNWLQRKNRSNHSAPPLLGCKNDLGSAGFCWSYADHLGYWLAAQSALTFISNVLLQVYRRQASMFTKYPLPAEVQMFSVVRCLRPARIVVEQANRHHVFAQSHVRSLRSVALAVGHWSSSMVTSLSWRSAIVELSQYSTQASSSHGRLT